jgi:uncharacterized protein GlcG (DUF336 family)
MMRSACCQRLRRRPQAGIAYNIAVVDAGGHLLAFVRQDGALIGSIDLAIDKAVKARIFRPYDLVSVGLVSLHLICARSAVATSRMRKHLVAVKKHLKTFNVSGHNPEGDF